MHKKLMVILFVLFAVFLLVGAHAEKNTTKSNSKDSKSSKSSKSFNKNDDSDSNSVILFEIEGSKSKNNDGSSDKPMVDTESNIIFEESYIAKKSKLSNQEAFSFEEISETIKSHVNNLESISKEVEVVEKKRFLGLFSVESKVVNKVDKYGRVLKKEKGWLDFFSVSDSENKSLEIIKQIDDVYVQVKDKFELDLNDYFYGAKSFEVDSDYKFVKVKKNILTVKSDDEGVYPVIVFAKSKEDSLEIKFNIFVTNEIIEVDTFQLPAILGESVKWKKEILVDKQGKFKVKLPKGSKNVKVKKISQNKIVEDYEVYDDSQFDVSAYSFIDKIEVNYETSAPILLENNSDINNQFFEVVGHDDIHYTNIKSFKMLNYETSDVQLINLNGDVDVEIRKLDLNGNGLYDHIEWDIPYLSSQSYIIVSNYSGNESVLLENPSNEFLNSSNVDLSCLVFLDNLTNVSLFADFNGSYALVESNYSELTTARYIFTENVADGLYEWNCQACDNASCYDAASNNIFAVDTTNPSIAFTNISLEDGVEHNHNNFTVFVDVNETNEEVISFILDYNNITFIESFSDNRRSYEWSNLSDGFYTYYITINDTVSNTISTEIRSVIIDTTIPFVESSSSYWKKTFKTNVDDFNSSKDYFLREKSRIKIEEGVLNTFTLATIKIEEDITFFRTYNPLTYFNLTINQSKILNLSDFYYNLTLNNIYDKKSNISIMLLNKTVN